MTTDTDKLIAQWKKLTRVSDIASFKIGDALAVALEAAEAARDAAYQDAASAEHRAGLVFESERECWDRERAELKAALEAAEERIEQLEAVASALNAALEAYETEYLGPDTPPETAEES